MSYDALAELAAVLDQYAVGTLSVPVLRACLEAPRLSAALRALAGLTIALPSGDQISVGTISGASGVAIGAGAIAVDDLTLQVIRQTMVHGSQTNISGSVTGPVLSGTFTGPVSIGAPVTIQNEAPNQGAQGVFNQPVTINNYGAQAMPPTSTPAAVGLRRDTMQRRAAALAEEYTAVSAQIDTTLDAGQRVILKRKADALLAELAQVQRDLATLG